MSFEMAPSKFHGISWNLATLNWAVAEFGGIPWNITWNPGVIRNGASKFHGIPWNLVTFDLAPAEFHGIPWNIPWNSVEPWCHLRRQTTMLVSCSQCFRKGCICFIPVYFHFFFSTQV